MIALPHMRGSLARRIISAAVPTHALLPVLGTSSIKPVYVNNDEVDDTFMEAIAAAAHLRGGINLIGWCFNSSIGHGWPAPTSGDNPTFSAAYADQQDANRTLEVDYMDSAGWNVAALPALAPMFRDMLDPNHAGSDASTPRVNHPAVPSFLALVAAHATAEQPLIYCAGGNLTHLADAWLADNSIASLVTVIFVGGSQGVLANFSNSAHGFYNPWSDPQAAKIVHNQFQVVYFPTEGTAQTNFTPIVTDSRLQSDLPASNLRTRLVNKAHPFNGLPGDRDCDGQTIIVAADPDYVTGVTRASVSGSFTRSQGTVTNWFADSPTRSLPNVVANPSGNIYYITGTDQTQGTATWWNFMDASLWTNATGDLLTNGDFESSDFGGDNIATITELTGWTASGNLLVERIQSDNTTYTVPSGVYPEAIVVFNDSNRAVNGVLEQTITTVVGAEYNISYAAGFLFFATATMGIRLDVISGGSTILTQNNTRAGSTGCHWEGKEYTFTATGTSTTIRFTDISSATSAVDAMLANVKVERLI